MANCHNCERLVICPWASPEEIICSSFKPKPITNADRIRSMTDEEMAELFTGYYYDGPKFWCPAEADIGEDECANADDCRECFLNWLKQEVDE